MGERIGFPRKGGGLWRSLRDGDFEEEDVWAVLDDRRSDDYSSFNPQQNMEYSSVSTRRKLLSAARAITKTEKPESSVTSSEEDEIMITQQSAPVNIPKWGNHYGRYPEEGTSTEEAEDEDYGNRNRMAPHEILARRLARSQISSFSVVEGVGRKLKGRDLSKVRNAVLTRTGFLEQ